MTRTVTVLLKAVNTQFDAAFQQSSGKAKGLGDEVKRTRAKSHEAFTEIGHGAVVLGGVLVASFGLAANASMKFQKQMSEVGAVSGASAKELRQLSDAALQAGKATVFSANDAARAEAELAKGGVKVKEILGGGLTGALNLAAAGQLDVGRAAEIAATSMVQFGLAGKDVSHIADLLAAGSNKALGSVDDLAQGLKYVGPIAAQMGVSIDQTVGTLAALAQNGILSEQAGTSLRGMLSSLTSPSAKAATELERLGLNVFDAGGEFVGFDGIAGQLKGTLGGLTEEQRSASLGIIFGNEQLTAARVLYKGGAEDINAWTEAVNQNGYAAELAAKKMDNLAGDVENLKGSIETALIKSGSSANGVLREMTQGANSLVSAYLDLPPQAQAVATGFAGIAGAGLLVGGGAMILIPKIAKLDQSLRDMTGGAIGAKKALGGIARVGIAAGVVVGITQLLDAINTAGSKAPPKLDALSQGLVDVAESGKANGALLKVAGDDFLDLRRKIDTAGKPMHFWEGLDFKTGAKTIKEAREELAQLDKALAGLVSSGHSDAAASAFKDIEAALATTGMDPGQIQDKFGAYFDALSEVAVTSGTAGTAIDKTTGRINDQAIAAQGAADALKNQADQLKAMTDPVFAFQKAISGQIDAAESYAQAVKKHGKASKEATAALFDQAQANVDVSASAADLAGAIATGATSVGRMTNQLQTWVGQGLLTQAQADALAKKVLALTGQADKLSQTPADLQVKEHGASKVESRLKSLSEQRRLLNSQPVRIPVELSGIDRVIYQLTHLPKVTVPVRAVTAPGGALDPLGLGLLPRKAKGGLGGDGQIFGPGTGTSDSILTWVSDGEFVVNAASTAKNLPLLKAINDAPRFAKGGPVGYNPKGGSLQSQAAGVVRRGGGVDDIQALIASMDAYLHKLDQAAQRERLLRDIHDAQVARAKASAKERASAQQQVVDAQKALASFDQAARVEREKTATDKLIASLERQARVETERHQRLANMYELGKISTAAAIRDLDAQMARLVKYSDEWMSVYRQKRQILDEVAAKEKQAAEDRAAAQEKQAAAQKAALDKLNALLDEQEQTRKKIADSARQHDAKQSELRTRQVKAETDLLAGLDRAAADRAANQQRILQGRRTDLSNWIAADAAAVTQWGASLSWLKGNVDDQISRFGEWMAELQQARRRGVSEGVITALGLDKGPEALSQLRQFSSASQAEIDALNDAIAQKAALAAEQTSREQAAGYGQLGRDLAEVQQTYADATTALQAEYQSTVADLAKQTTELQAEFQAEQVQYAEDLAKIGTDQARGYTEALAAGLSSGIPAVEAAAKALAAAASGGFSGGGTGVGGSAGGAGSGGGQIGVVADNGTNPWAAIQTMAGEILGYGAYGLETHGDKPPTFTKDGVDYTSKEMAAAFKASYGYTIGEMTYDSGGWLMPGQVGINRGTRPEPVFSPSQWDAIRNGGMGGGGGDVRVFIGERELTDIVRVEREQGLGARKNANAIAGRR
jgi:TP901 family phage tail tape measure protein